MTALRSHRTCRTRHLLVACVATACLLGGTAAPVGAAATRSRAQTSQQLAVLLTGHSVHSAPRAGSRLLGTVAAQRPITGETTALPVVGRTRGAGGVAWLKVMLPGRPNGSTGWIAQQGTRAAATGWRIRVDLGRRRVTVYNHGAIARVFAAVVGQPSTPTPTGSFFVEETLQMYAGEPGGPFALALSARSDVLQEFEGGPGQVAIHGRDNLGGILGNAESHGCMRVDTPNIDWLAARIGPGVPVAILRD
jgi:lipoprotein-anchoring transpeptidase ErfK/SrfK